MTEREPRATNRAHVMSVGARRRRCELKRGYAAEAHSSLSVLWSTDVEVDVIFVIAVVNSRASLVQIGVVTEEDAEEANR